MLAAVWHDYLVARGISVFTATVKMGYNVAETVLGLKIMSGAMDHARWARLA